MIVGVSYRNRAAASSTGSGRVSARKDAGPASAGSFGNGLDSNVTGDSRRRGVCAVAGEGNE